VSGAWIKKKARINRTPISHLLARWLYIDLRLYAAINLTVFVFKTFNIIPYQNKDMAVDRAAFIFGHKPQLAQHLFLNPNGYAFYCHKTPSLRKIDIPRIYFIAVLWYNAVNGYAVYLTYVYGRVGSVKCGEFGAPVKVFWLKPEKVLAITIF